MIRSGANGDNKKHEEDPGFHAVCIYAATTRCAIRFGAIVENKKCEDDPNVRAVCVPIVTKGNAKTTLVSTLHMSLSRKKWGREWSSQLFTEMAKVHVCETLYQVQE